MQNTTLEYLPLSQLRERARLFLLEKGFPNRKTHLAIYSAQGISSGNLLID